MREKKFNQIKYQNEFNKKNYDRIEIVVPKGKKEVIKNYATKSGQSLSAYIGKAVDARIEKELNGVG